jgi:anti-anti-sigma factor
MAPQRNGQCPAWSAFARIPAMPRARVVFRNRDGYKVNRLSFTFRWGPRWTIGNGAETVGSASLLVQDYGGVMVASITHAAMLDSVSIESTGEALYRLVDERNCRKVIIDFADVKFLSSQAIGVVITMHNKIKAAKGELALCGVRAEILTVFKLTGLTKVLTFFPDDSAALKKFGVFLH